MNTIFSEVMGDIMDTSSDFIRSEFLNIIFFQQKNLVIFPYVDLKYLHALEIFTTGYNIVDLESTALHNLKEILEFESNNSYSQYPSLYFIYNVDREKVRELIKMDQIRCIINSNDRISDLANGSKFIFFNKKNNQFLNYNLTASELEFEDTLIADSQDEELLKANLQKIKIAATRIFKELNHSGKLENLPDILTDYNNKYWNSILEFTSRYYDINVPDISGIKLKARQNLRDFSDEYKVLITTNRALGKEFIQQLHEFRIKKVNPAHLELEELYNPQKLYNYLRNHHWKNGIPEDFIHEWAQMKISNYKLKEEDQSDFTKILMKLGLKINKQNSPHIKSLSLSVTNTNTPVKIASNYPSIKNKWFHLRKGILEQLQDLKYLSRKYSNSSKEHSYLLKELSEILILLGRNKASSTFDEKNTQIIPEPAKTDIIMGMKKLKIDEWFELSEIDNKVEFVIDFINLISNLYDDVFNNSKKIDITIKIKEFKFPKNLEKKLIWFNQIRNKIIVHRKLKREERNNLLKKNEIELKDTYLHLLAYLLKFHVLNVAKKYNFINIININNFVITKYLRNTSLSQQETAKIREFLYQN